MKTKDLGLLAEQTVIIDCIKRGYTVAQVCGDNAPYDLLVDKGDGNILKLQVKCRTPRNDRLSIEGYTMTYDRSRGSNNRSKQNFYNKQNIDYFVAVHSDTLEIYYIPIEIFNDVKIVHLCLVTPDVDISAFKGIKLASDFVNF